MTPAPPAARAPSGRSYTILAPLGQGGFGTVYLGQLMAGSGFVKPVAIKILHAEAAAVPEVARRLRDEARLLALLRHRAIVGVDDLVQIDGRWAVVMEYVEGADLQTLLCGGPLPARVACEIAREVAGALRAAHEAVDPNTKNPLHIVHRDIKPANVRLTPGGEVKVLDFGIARSSFETREAATRSMAFGSSGYMAPERFDGRDLPAGDVYALGLTLLECLTGGPVGQPSVNQRAHDGRIGALVEDLAGKAQLLGPILRGMLAYEPGDRPTAAAVARALQDLTGVLGGAWLSDWAPAAIATAKADSPQPRAEGATSGDSFASSPPPAPVLPLLHLPESGGDAAPTVFVVTRFPTSPRPIPPERGPRAARLALAAGAALVAALLALVVILAAGVVWRASSGADEVPPAEAGSTAAAEPEAARGPEDLPPPPLAPDPAPAGPRTGTQPEVPVKRAGPALPTRSPPTVRSPGAPHKSPSEPEKPTSTAGPSPWTTTAPPAPTVAPLEVAVVPSGRLTVKGDARVHLVDRAGTDWLATDAIPVGTYTAVALFPDGTIVRAIDPVVIAAGKTTVVRCSYLFLTCN